MPATAIPSGGTPSGRMHASGRGSGSSWWQRDVIAPGKLPLMLCFLAFVITFVVTRPNPPTPQAAGDDGHRLAPHRCSVQGLPLLL